MGALWSKYTREGESRQDAYKQTGRVDGRERGWEMLSLRSLASSYSPGVLSWVRCLSVCSKSAG